MSLPLERLQRWMQSVVVHPGTVEDAVADPSVEADVPKGRVGDVILPSAHLAPLERLEIYHAMYPLRMEEALASDYPGLKHFLGDQGFFRLVEGYVQAHPSRSFTLNPLGRHLPEYLAGAADVTGRSGCAPSSSRHSRRSESGSRGQGNAPPPRLRKRGFCQDLARLERAVAEVFEDEERPALDEQAIAAVPAEAWEHARLRTIPAFRLLALRYPASAYLDSVNDEKHRHPEVKRQDGWVAVYRRSYSVYRHDLGRAAHDLLTDLVAGRTVGEAVAAAMRRRGRARPQADDLFRWFRQWAAAGMFAEVHLP